MIAEVVAISPVKNPTVTFRPSMSDEGVVDIGLTKIAAVRVVDLVTRVLGFGGSEFDEFAPDLGRDLAGIDEIVIGERGRDRDGRLGIGAEVIEGELEDQSRIDSATVGDEDSVKACDEGLEFGFLFRGDHGETLGNPCAEVQP